MFNLNIVCILFFVFPPLLKKIFILELKKIESAKISQRYARISLAGKTE